MNTTAENIAIMSPDRTFDTLTSDMHDALPFRVQEALRVRRALVDLHPRLEQTWQAKGDADAEVQRVTTELREAGRDPAAMERRRIVRSAAVTLHAAYITLEQQHKFYCSQWDRCLALMERREGLWVYMMCAENATMRRRYREQVVDIDTKARIAQVPHERWAQVYKEHSRYGWAQWITRFADKTLTFLQEEDLEQWARDDRMLVTASHLYGCWVVFDFVDVVPEQFDVTVTRREQ